VDSRWEAILRSGNPELVLKEARSCHYPETGDVARAAVAVCRAAAALEKWGLVVTWAERGLAALPGPDTRSWLLYLLGVALSNTGDIFRAVRSLREAARLTAGSPRIGFLSPYVLLALGYAMRYQRDFREELSSFQQAAVEFANLGRYSQSALCHLEAAWSSLLAGDTDTATIHLESLHPLLREHADPDLRNRVEAARALFFVLVGEHQQAQVIASDLLRQTDLTPNCRADVQWTLGLSRHAVGDSAEAYQLATAAYEDALVDVLPLQVSRIETLLGQVRGEIIL